MKKAGRKKRLTATAAGESSENCDAELDSGKGCFIKWNNRKLEDWKWENLVSLILNERGGSDGTGRNFTAESERSVGP